MLGACGGAGASTVAVNLAGLLAAQTQSTGLIDLRLLSGDLASLLDLKPQYTVADFCSRIERMDRAMFDQLFTVHPSGVQLLAAPWDALQHHTICAQKVRLLFAMARTKFSHLVLDVDSHLGEIDAEALGQSDLVLIVTRLDFIAVRSARRLLDRLAMLGVPAEAIEVVANRRGQAKELSVAQAERALGSKIRHSLADDPKRAVGAATLGKLVSTTSRWSRLARDFRQLAADVLKTTAHRDSPPTQGR